MPSNRFTNGLKPAIMSIRLKKAGKVKSYGETGVGLVRERNDDALWVDEDRLFFAVADGLGGLPGGNVASQMAIEALRQSDLEALLKKKNGLENCFKKISKEIWDRGSKINPDIGIATTLTFVAIRDAQLIGEHAGDSGVVIFKKKGWKKLTTDHTMAEEIRRRLELEDKATVPDYYNHILTECLGKGVELNPEKIVADIESGDRILLYTDGVTKAFNFEELKKMIFKAKAPKEFVKAVICKANERGGIDNTTAIAIFVE